MQPDDYYLFCGCFRQLATSREEETRILCARRVLSSANATNVAAFNADISRSLSAGSGSSAYIVYFHDIFMSLASDTAEGVRRAAAEQLPDVMRLVPAKDVSNVFGETLLKLLRDESLTVAYAVLPHLEQVLMLMSECSDIKAIREAVLSDMVAALVDLEARCALKNIWRPQRTLSMCFPAFLKMLSKEQVAEHLLPMAFRWLSPSSAAVLRPYAAEGIALLLRHGLLEKQRAEAYVKLIRVFARGKAFSHRIAFVQVTKHIVRE
jgi:serine/threonine-protein phosphatase 4 regulatory subunit 4